MHWQSHILPPYANCMYKAGSTSGTSMHMLSVSLPHGSLCSAREAASSTESAVTQIALLHESASQCRHAHASSMSSSALHLPVATSTSSWRSPLVAATLSGVSPSLSSACSPSNST